MTIDQKDFQNLTKTVHDQEKTIAQLKTLITKVINEQQKIIQQLNSTKHENRQLKQDLAYLQQTLRRL